MYIKCKSDECKCIQNGSQTKWKGIKNVNQMKWKCIENVYQMKYKMYVKCK